MNKQKYLNQSFNTFFSQMLKKSNRIFVDFEKIDQNMFCSICFEVFEDPCTLSCKHTFCYSCIVIERSIRKSCPVCRNVDVVFKPVKDVFLSSYINHLSTKCSHEGCQWTGQYIHLKNHQRLCEYRPEKIKKNSDLGIINVKRGKDVIQIDDDHRMGRKKVHIGQTDNPQVSIFSIPAQQKSKLLLLPPIFQVASFRPVNRRFFDQPTNVPIPMISRSDGNQRNPIDLGDNSYKRSQNSNNAILNKKKIQLKNFQLINRRLP